MIPDQGILLNAGFQKFSIGKLRDFPDRVDDGNFLETLVDLRVSDQTEEGRKPCSRCQKYQPFSWGEGVENERPRRLFADDYGVAGFDFLQLRRQGAVFDLDRKKLQFVRIARARDGICSEDRPWLSRQSEHDEFAGSEPKALRARDLEAEQTFRPMTDPLNLDGVKWLLTGRLDQRGVHAVVFGLAFIVEDDIRGWLVTDSSRRCQCGAQPA